MPRGEGREAIRANRGTHEQTIVGDKTRGPRCDPAGGPLPANLGFHHEWQDDDLLPRPTPAPAPQAVAFGEDPSANIYPEDPLKKAT